MTQAARRLWTVIGSVSLLTLSNVLGAQTQGNAKTQETLV